MTQLRVTCILSGIDLPFSDVQIPTKFHRHETPEKGLKTKSDDRADFIPVFDVYFIPVSKDRLLSTEQKLSPGSRCIENCNYTQQFPTANFDDARLTATLLARFSAPRSTTTLLLVRSQTRRESRVFADEARPKKHTQNTQHRRGPAANWQPSWLSAWANNGGRNYSGREIVRAHRALSPEGVFPATWPRKRSSPRSVWHVKAFALKLPNIPFTHTHAYAQYTHTHTCVRLIWIRRLGKWRSTNGSRVISSSRRRLCRPKFARATNDKICVG